MRLMISALAAAMLVVVALPCAAQEKDIPGSKDPRLLTRMPGFYISVYKDVQFDRSRVPGPNAESGWETTR